MRDNTNWTILAIVGILVVGCVYACDNRDKDESQPVRPAVVQVTR